MAIDNLADWVISVDDHLIEPPGLWQERLPNRFKERGPRVVHEEQGDIWLYEGSQTTLNGLVTQAGVDPSDHSPREARYADLPTWCYEPVARLDAMNRDGILASLCFPTFPRVCGQVFSEGTDRELGLLCIQAYNDFMIDDWCGSAPGRFIPCIILPLWDTRLAAAEIERCAAKGAKAVTFSEGPASLGLPSIHDPGRYWDPLFDAAAQTGLSLALHLGSSSTMPSAHPDASPIVPWVRLGWRAAETLSDWIFSDIFARFPSLKVELSESGIGWLPSALARCDYVHARYGAWVERYGMNRRFVTDKGEGFTTWAHGDLTPTDVYRAHIRGCCIANQDGFVADTVRQLGPAYVFLETDFPHSDSTWPQTHEFIDEVLSGFTLDEQYALRRGNAEAWYGFTPTEPSIVGATVTA